MQALGGGVFSYERGTPVRKERMRLFATSGMLLYTYIVALQGYLAHKKQPHPRTLQ